MPAKGMKNSDLTEQQLLFIEEYLCDFNGTHAVIRSGYNSSKPDIYAVKLLNSPKIKREIAKRMAEGSKKYGISQERALRELGKLAFTKLEDIIDLTTGNIKEGADTATVKTWRRTRTGTIVELYDKYRALEIIAKYLGIANMENENERELGVIQMPIVDTSIGENNE